MASTTAERDEYAGVPRRPGEGETPGQELSHRRPMPASWRIVMSTRVSHDGRARSRRRAQNCPIGGRWPASWRGVMDTRVSHDGRARSRRRAKNCPIGGRWPASWRGVMGTRVSHDGRARSRRRAKNCPIRRPMASVTAERDEYAGVPRRPGAVETPGQELSHPKREYCELNLPVVENGEAANQ